MTKLVLALWVMAVVVIFGAVALTAEATPLGSLAKIKSYALAGAADWLPVPGPTLPRGFQMGVRSVCRAEGQQVPLRAVLNA
jgi:hypothetical protein